MIDTIFQVLICMHMSIPIRVITICFFFQRYKLENLTGCGSISKVSIGYLWCNWSGKFLTRDNNSIFCPAHSSIHATFTSQLVSHTTVPKAVCPKCCTNLYPSLENASAMPMLRAWACKIAPPLTYIFDPDTNRTNQLQTPYPSYTIES